MQRFGEPTARNVVITILMRRLGRQKLVICVEHLPVSYTFSFKKKFPCSLYPEINGFLYMNNPLSKLSNILT